MTYDVEFYRQEGETARKAAACVVPTVAGMFRFETVMDVGAGTGEWAEAARNLGKTAWTIDHKVPVDMLVNPLWHVDLNLNACQLWWPTDLAICVEVAEHLLPSTGPKLVEGLARAKRVLFSAATPGQPGDGHINCRPHGYWHLLFAEYGFTPQYVGNRFGDQVAGFYRNNMYVYSRDSWFKC